MRRGWRGCFYRSDEADIYNQGIVFDAEVSLPAQLRLRKAYYNNDQPYLIYVPLRVFSSGP